MRQFFLKRLKRIFHSLGLEIQKYNGSNSPRRTTLAEILDNILKSGFSPQTVIDVGVAYGTDDLYEKFPDTNLFLVEPLKEYEEVLKKISQQYKSGYVLAAAGDKPGTIIMNVHPDLSGSSTFKEAEGDQVNGIPRKVDMVTLDDLCQEKDLRGPYLIKVDVQGAEISVLEGSKKILKDTEVVILEVSLFGFYINGPQIFDVVKAMKELGFVVYDIFGGHNRPLDNALAQVDLVFVKENGLFRKHHFYATADQRERITEKLQARNP